LNAVGKTRTTNHIRSKRNAAGTVKPPANAEKSSTMKDISVTVATAVGVISLAGLVMTLMGFGVAMAAGTSFGVSFLRVAESPFQCLKLSSIVFIQAFNTVDAIEHDLGDALVFCSVATLGLVLYVLIYGLIRLVKKDEAAVKTKSFVRRARDFLVRMPSSGALLFGLFVGVAGVFISYVFKALVLFVPVLVVMFPMIGYGLGNRFFYEATIEPKECVSLVNAANSRVNRAQSLSAKDVKPKSSKREFGVTCVALTKLDGQEVMRGRLALELSDAVILYFPDTGVGEIVPNKDLRTVKVSTLKPMAPPTPLPTTIK
jgi:hypothetical protein